MFHRQDRKIAAALNTGQGHYPKSRPPPFNRRLWLRRSRMKRSIHRPAAFSREDFYWEEADTHLAIKQLQTGSSLEDWRLNVLNSAHCHLLAPFSTTFWQKSGLAADKSKCSERCWLEWSLSPLTGIFFTEAAHPQWSASSVSYEGCKQIISHVSLTSFSVFYSPALLQHQHKNLPTSRNTFAVLATNMFHMNLLAT